MTILKLNSPIRLDPSRSLRYRSDKFSTAFVIDLPASQHLQLLTTMQLGLSETLPALVARRFAAAKEGRHLVFSSTHLAILNVAGIPVPQGPRHAEDKTPD